MMKIVLIIVGIIILAFILVQWYAMREQQNIETYPYTVVKEYDSFEIRSYEPSLFTAVNLPADSYKNASSKGFSILANYIFGDNEKNEKIAMTSPVSMSLGDSMDMMFLVPQKFNKKDLPRPNNQQIQFKEEPAKTVAAITFGGWADDEKIAKYKTQLINALQAENIAYTNRFYFLGYNAPYDMINRRNEIIVELKKEVSSQ